MLLKIFGLSILAQCPAFSIIYIFEFPDSSSCHCLASFNANLLSFSPANISKGKILVTSQLAVNLSKPYITVNDFQSIACHTGTMKP